MTDNDMLQVTLALLVGRRNLQGCYPPSASVSNGTLVSPLAQRRRIIGILPHI